MHEKVFDILIGKRKVISNLDIFSKVGKSTGYDEYLEFEIKSSKKLRTKDYSGLLKLQEEFPLKKKMVVSLVPHSFIEDNGVEVYNVSDFLSLLWAQDLF